jgi:hypothetical protein
MSSLRPSLLPRLLSLLALGAVLTLSASTAHAQKRAQTGPSWTQNFEAQMSAVLAQPESDIRSEGLRTLLVLLQDAPASVATDALAPAVTNVVLDENAPEGVRIMALSVLDAMNSDTGYDALLRWARTDDIRSPRLERHVLRTLRAYQLRHGIA